MKINESKKEYLELMEIGKWYLAIDIEKNFTFSKATAYTNRLFFLANGFLVQRGDGPIKEYSRTAKEFSYAPAPVRDQKVDNETPGESKNALALLIMPASKRAIQQNQQHYISYRG